MRIAQRVHHSRQLQFVPIRVMDFHTGESSLYDVHRTSLVRCSSYYQTRQKATDMPDTQKLDTQGAVPEQEHETDVRPISSSRRAAAIEAAYILEAVRK